MTTGHLISVVTVCFNSAKTIRDALESVSNQTEANFEHIIVDGNSTDGTQEIVKNFLYHTNRFVSEPDNSIYDAMNKGISLAKGEIIGFLNSDDIFADNMVLSRVIDAFDDPKTEVCFGDILYITKDKNRVVRHWKSKEFTKGSFYKGWCPAHPTFYVRRSALNRLGGFDLRYHLAADVEFMLRYLECNSLKSVYIPTIQVFMRVGGATNKNLTNIMRQNIEIFNALNLSGERYSKIIFLLNKIQDRCLQRINGALYKQK